VQIDILDTSTTIVARCACFASQTGGQTRCIVADSRRYRQNDGRIQKQSGFII
jgi:hypothetical protein